jgi:hypothetical protein
VTTEETVVNAPEYEYSDRGFKHLHPVAGSYPNDQVRVCESSSAEGAFLWLRVRDSEGEAAVHLTLKQAAEVAAQLTWLVANHFALDDHFGLEDRVRFRVP